MTVSGEIALKYTHVKDEDNATFEIVAAAAGKTIKIYRLVISAAANVEIMVKSNTTVIGGNFMFGNFPFSYVEYPNFLELAAGEALNITKSTAGTDVYVNCWYELA